MAPDERNGAFYEIITGRGTEVLVQKSLCSPKILHEVNWE
jgi:hypothetical protein